MSQIFYPLIKHGFQKFNEYSLPVAGADTLGGVKVGNGLSIDENGVLSADGGGGSSDVLIGTVTTNENVSMLGSYLQYFNGVIYFYFDFDCVDTVPAVTAFIRCYFEDETLRANFDIAGGFRFLLYASGDDGFIPVTDVFATLHYFRCELPIPAGSYIITGSCPCGLVSNE